MALAGGCSSDGGLSCQRIQAPLEGLDYAVREIDADTRRVLPRVMDKYFAFFWRFFPPRPAVLPDPTVAPARWAQAQWMHNLSATAPIFAPGLIQWRAYRFHVFVSHKDDINERYP